MKVKSWVKELWEILPQQIEGLKHNLLSISQFQGNGFTITFYIQSCIIEHNTNKEIMFKGL